MGEDGDNGWRVWTLPGLLGVVLVVLVAATVILRSSQDDAPRSIAVDSGAAGAGALTGREASAVEEAASSALLTFYTLDYQTTDDYDDTVKPLLTDAFDKEFTRESVKLREAADSMQLVLEPSIAGDGDGIAVEYVGAEEAQVLVALDVRTTSPTAAPSESEYRIRVHLQREDGRWLASEFQRVSVR